MTELEVVNTVDYGNGPLELDLQSAREVTHCTPAGWCNIARVRGIAAGASAWCRA